mmetsp:Transcript_9245/g.19952  ORF Transcript_9245/g.19952 Transcript_9245/m.19952 type:complete len:587 (+) Transcript_9245:341-2101(+)|eukprot:CAMPEP_0168747916 /NCGR_PEP_ID=MMETSP0724-20121128/15904_1 /TAXON_ID=265536 /ORGANISM="Amphiprora sp., Strain CCMP467" /LENGTH=586 /DNA_ID=CAMNT_0008795723 /DNA_START=250 /DNA_END=2010 /DNA_ORIENTATION=+
MVKLSLFGAKLLLLSLPLQPVGGCTNIGSTPTWKEFTHELNRREEGFGSRRPFCPFVIEGENCPTADDPGYQVQFYLDLSCGDFHGGTGDGCQIHCPYAHIEVAPFAWLDIFSFHLSGSKSTFLTLGEGADVFGSRLTFSNNGSPDDSLQGGAIHIGHNARLQLEQPVFRGNAAYWGAAIFNQGELIIDGGDLSENKARYGGAVHNLGTLSVSGSNIYGNMATLDGGAINNAGSLSLEGCYVHHNQAAMGGALFIEGNQTSTLFVNAFQSNVADEAGPAILVVGDTSIINSAGNEGCGNEGEDSHRQCNGIATVDSECNEFQKQCIVPSVEPSLSPMEPSNLPSSTPSSQPSTMPSAEPSLAPSIAPTGKPSLTPSEQDSASPSLEPSTSQSPSVSSEPSQSLEPSNDLSKQPSASPSHLPTSGGSLQPSDSLEPSSSQSPSASPEPSQSAKPTNKPTSLRVTGSSSSSQRQSSLHKNFVSLSLSPTPVSTSEKPTWTNSVYPSASDSPSLSTQFSLPASNEWKSTALPREPIMGEDPQSSQSPSVSPSESNSPSIDVSWSSSSSSTPALTSLSPSSSNHPSLRSR